MAAGEVRAVAHIGGRAVRYDVRGPPSAPVVVFSNSLGTDLGMWDDQADVLAERWRVLRYDTRGHGGSSVPPGPYTFPKLADDVVQLLDYLDVREAHFCGLSMGGLTGLYLAAAHADRVQRVAVCSAAARFGTAATWNDRIAAVRAGGMAAIAPAVLVRWFTESGRARRPEAIARIERQLLATPPEGYIACCEALRDADGRRLVSAIRAPILVLAATHDPAVPTADARWVAEHVANGAYDELPTAHLSNVEDPEGFTRRLSAFLTG